MITGIQLNKARELLGSSTTTLAKLSGQPVRVVTMIEDSLKVPTGLSDNTFRRIRRAFEDAGVEFGHGDGDVAPPETVARAATPRL